MAFESPQIVKMDSDLVASNTEPIVIVSSAINPAHQTAVTATSSVIFLDNSIILPGEQPDLLQQALAEAALPTSSGATSVGASVVDSTNFQTLDHAKDAKEKFVTVFNSPNGTLQITPENAQALGIGISTNERKKNEIF